MNSEQLHYFELAYRERNYSAAARLVPCSPQGLAKAIHNLERELGVTLFSSDAETGLPVPTDYAHELYEYACVNDSNLRLLRESFERLRGEERRIIRVGFSLGVMGTLGPEFLEGFRRLHPNVTVDYWETDDRMCERGLRDGSFDLSVLVEPFAPGLATRVLYRAPIYFWMLADDPLAARESLCVRDFEGRDIAIPGDGFRCLHRLRAAADREGVSLGGVYQMSEIFNTYAFAAAGRGLGFTVRHIVEQPAFRADDRVVARPVAGFPWSFGVTRLETHVLGDAEREFWGWCASFARRLPSDPIEAADRPAASG